MKAYQINNGLNNSLQDRSIQRFVSNWRRHWGRVQQQIKGGQYFELLLLPFRL